MEMRLQNVVSEFAQKFPEVAKQLRNALNEKAKEPGYNPGTLEIYFDGNRVLRQEGKEVVDQRFFDPDYRPFFVFIYGDDELLLVKGRDYLLLNRLPDESQAADWKIYELN